MKLMSYAYGGRRSWGLVVGDSVVNLSRAYPQYPTLASYIAASAHMDAAQHAQGLEPEARLVDVIFEPVIPEPEKIFCVVRNYMDHHKEVLAAGMQRELAEFPPVFLRVWRSQCAHGQPIVKPRVSDSLDWEGELAVIIGKGGRDIPAGQAYEHVAGYACYNDASVREWQFHAKQIAAGKNFESTGAFGPWMVTADEIAPGAELAIEVRLNGEVMQSSHTGHMIFPIPQLINYVSTIVTLTPGDVIVTGTPAGVGWSRKPPRFMQDGDTVEVEIQGIGVLSNPVRIQD